MEASCRKKKNLTNFI